MSKVVTLNAKNVLGKDFSVIDTFENVKKTNKGLLDMFKAMDDVEDKAKEEHRDPLLPEYGMVINEYILKNVTKLLNLGSEDAKKLNEMSRSDLAEFYQKVAEEFCQMQVPTMGAVTGVGEDTKQSKEELKTVDPK
ncbi:hypothetical protein LJ16_03620 [Lactobacillus johnsonii 16]|nr:hypothetical protein LJ16_03620 [Lactobacillus johnsonii 16]